MCIRDRLKGITKTFGSVIANKDINLQLRHGEILSLLGENGSGKTTLMNMLSGIYKPDSGSIYVEGKQVTINSPEDAKKLGIGMVHQHFKLIESFTVADNIWIGKESESKKLKDKLSGVILKKRDVYKRQPLDSNSFILLILTCICSLISISAIFLSSSINHLIFILFLIFILILSRNTHDLQFSEPSRDINFYDIADSMTPVSYTHLDVYKRQAHNESDSDNLRQRRSSACHFWLQMPPSSCQRYQYNRF